MQQLFSTPQKDEAVASTVPDQVQRLKKNFCQAQKKTCKKYLRVVFLR
jgi:hypothetical protein